MSIPDIISKPKRMPPWMSMPGAPPRPDNAAFGTKLAELVAEKRKLYEELSELQKSMEESKKGDEDEEGKLLRQRLSDIDEDLRSQNTLRVEKNTEITKLRQQSRDANRELKALQTELGGLSSTKEIDQVIEHVMRKMETSGGGLQAEKKALKRLKQLEDVKGIFFKLQTLTETIRDTEEREVLLQQEYREIHERIGTLNKELETNIQAKQERSKESQATGAVRSEIYQKTLKVRASIRDINDQMNQLRAEHTKATDAWNAWCDSAREKHNAELQAKFEERKRRQQERIEAAKERKKESLLRQLQHEHKVEISACDTLVQYLREKKRVVREEEEEEAKRNAAADFDPAKAAPQGCIVLNQSKWAPNKSVSRADKKQQKRQEKTAKPDKSAEGKHLYHPKEIVNLFHKIGLEPPHSLANFDDSVIQINEKKGEYETILPSDADSSSSEKEAENNEEGEQEQQECSKEDDKVQEKEEPEAAAQS